MYKHKLICKSFGNKDRVKGSRLGGDRDQDFDFDSESEQELSNELQELDFNTCGYQEEDNFTIQHFLENLQEQKTPYPQEESSGSQQQDSNEDSCYGGSYSLSRLNAAYMKKMGRVGSALSENSSMIRFDSTVRVKFFNDQQPVAQVCDAQQYTTTFNQYLQSFEAERSDE